jgi:hypothetical protein
MNGGKSGTDASGRTKRGRKQMEDTDSTSDRKTKKAKKEIKVAVSDKGHQRPIAPAAAIFPVIKPAPPLQPYREASVASSEVIFPPLPAESGFRQLSSATSRSSSRATSQVDGDASSPSSSSILDSQFIEPSSSASTSSVPELTPNCSSSSPPPSSSEMELDAPIQIADGPLCLAPSATVAGLDSDEEDGSQNVFSSKTTLTPVQFWGESTRLKELSRLGGKLNFSVPSAPSDDESEDEGLLLSAVKSKNRKTLLAVSGRPILLSLLCSLFSTGAI